MNTEIRIYERRIEQPKGLYVTASAGRWARAEITKSISEKYEEETGEVLENAFSRINFVTTKNRKNQSVICTGTLVVEVPVATPVEPVVVIDEVEFDFDFDLYARHAGLEPGDEVSERILGKHAEKSVDVLLADVLINEGELTVEEITDPVEGLTALPSVVEQVEAIDQPTLDEVSNFFAMSLLARRGVLSPEELEQYNELLGTYREAGGK